ncbi:HEAT repeat domain-containing protein [bacterium]|nr:HEAT repeat domain-containing protein [bacterium]
MKELDQRLNQIVKLFRAEETRWDAILELKLLNDSNLVAQMVRLLDDKDWVVRWAIAEKLGEMKIATAIPALTRLLKDRDFHVRKNAVKALVKFGPEVTSYLVTQFSHPHFSVRRHISLIISHFGERAVPYMIKDFALRDWVSANRIVYAINDIGGDRESVFLELLGNPDVQKPLIILLGQLKIIRSAPYLIRLFKNPYLRRCIVDALHDIGEKQSYPVIVTALRKGSPSIRSLAEEVALKIGDPMLPYLVKGMLDPEAPVKRLIHIIEEIGPDSIMPTVHRLALRNSAFKSIASELIAKYPGHDHEKRGGLLNLLGID